MRSGTLDVAAVAGFAAALEVAVRDRRGERQRGCGALREQLIGGGPARRSRTPCVHGACRPGRAACRGWPTSASRAARPTRC